MAVGDTQNNDGTQAPPDGTKAPEGQQQQQTTPQKQNGTQEPAPGQNGRKPDADRGLVADLQRERAARKELETKIAQLSGTLTAEQKRVRALAGLETKSEADTETDEIRTRLLSVMPELGELSNKEFLSTLKKLTQMLPSLERTTQHYWGKHGLNSLQSIEKKIGETFGDLTERQVATIRAAYVTKAETDAKFAQRHEDDPEGLIEEFAQEWIEDWFETSKRRVTATEVERLRRVPGARDRNLVTPGDNRPIDVNDPKAVEDILVGGFKAKGGAFGRR